MAAAAAAAKAAAATAAAPLRSHPSRVGAPLLVRASSACLRDH